ncbi:putative phospholipase B-like 2 [Haemaphysalis longicornis]
MVASRLASSGHEWAAIFSRFNSGTGKVTSDDITDRLKNQGFWASYNEAYFRDIAVQTRPPGENRRKNHYREDPRALTVFLLQSEVVDLKTTIHFMRYNMLGGWPLESDNCSVLTRTHYASMSPRLDISRLTATGATDMKVTSYSLFQSLEFIGIAGPTSQGVEPFVWSRSPFSSYQHFGQPDVWDFGPVHHQWGQC